MDFKVSKIGEASDPKKKLLKQDVPKAVRYNELNTPPVIEPNSNKRVTDPEEEVQVSQLDQIRVIEGH